MSCGVHLNQPKISALGKDRVAILSGTIVSFPKCAGCVVGICVYRIFSTLAKYASGITLGTGNLIKRLIAPISSVRRKSKQRRKDLNARPLKELSPVGRDFPLEFLLTTQQGRVNIELHSSSRAW